MAYVFISYARQSQAVAQAVAERLLAGGLEVWWDEQIPAHRAYAEVIEEQLRGAACVIVLWSKEAAKSQWVRAEADVARASGKLVQAVLDGSTPPLPFDQLQHADLGGWSGDPNHPGWRKVEASVRHLTGAPGAVAAPSMSPAAQRRLPRAAWLGLGAAAALTVLGLVGWRLSHPSADVGAPQAAAKRPTPQLRISPFTPLSPDIPPTLVAQAHEEIVAAFGQTSFVDIVTTPATRDPGPISWTLTGAVGRMGTDLHFVIHLVHDSTGQVIWSETFDRPVAQGDSALKSIGAEVEEIVASSLTAAAGYEGRGPLPDATLAHFMQWNQDTVLPGVHFRHGEEELRRAVAQTPDFAEGWAWLAAAFGATATLSDNPADVAAARAEAPAVIATALRYRPHDPVALMARAKVMPPADFLGRDAAFRAAIAGPTSPAGVEHSAYSVLLMDVGRLGEAIRQADIAYELDPLDPSLVDRYAKALTLSGQAALADQVIDRKLVIWPGDPAVVALRIRGALWTKAYDRAVGLIQADPAGWPGARGAMLAAFAALKSSRPQDRSAAIAALTGLAQDPATLSPFVVSALGALGANEQAIAAADRLIAARSAMAADVLFEPALAEARQTPAFAALAERTGLTAYWRTSRQPPDFCAAKGAPALCATLR